MKLEHIGIAVKSLQNSDDLFSRLLGNEHYKQESVEREGVKTSFYNVGESKIELLEATNSDSAIAKYLDKNREGVHHLAFSVDNISEEIKRLETEITKLEAEVARCNKMLSNPGFVNKAPEAKVNEEKEKLAKYEEMLNASKERLAKLKG